MAIELLITEEGYRSMLTKGLSSAITKFSINDQYKIYGLDTDHTLPPLSGTKPNLGNSNPAFNLAKYKGVPQDPLSTDEIDFMSKRIAVKLFSADCSGGFDVNTLNVKIHLARYFNNLESIMTQSYNFNMEGLSYKIYDYVYSNIEKENVVNGGYDIIDNIRRLNLSIGFNSDSDRRNYFKLNNRYVTFLSGGESILINERNNNLYFSPFHLDFTSVDGVPGSSLLFKMMPDTFGYTIDGEFLSLKEGDELINGSGTGSFNSIIPTAKVGNKDFYLENNNMLNTKDPLLGQFIYGFKNSNKTLNLMQELIERGKMFIQTNGINNNGVYSLPIGYKINVNGDDEFNNIYLNNNYGGNVVVEFIYNPTDITTTNIVEVI